MSRSVDQRQRRQEQGRPPHDERHPQLASFWREYKHVPWCTLLLTAVYPVVCGVWYPNVERLAFLRLDTWSRVQAWRIYTYSLLHAGAVHVVSNLVMLWVAGAPLEAAHSPLVYAFVHTLGVLHGACGVGWEARLASPDHTMGRPNDSVAAAAAAAEPVIAVGASGAVYAMFGAQAANLAAFWSRMPLRWVRLAVLATFLGAEIVLWYHFYDGDISYGGHLGGFVGGVLSGGAVLPLLSLLPVPLPSFLLRSMMKLLGKKGGDEGASHLPHPDETAIVIEDGGNNNNNNNPRQQQQDADTVAISQKAGRFTTALSLSCWFLLAAYTAAGLGNYFA